MFRFAKVLAVVGLLYSGTVSACVMNWSWSGAVWGEPVGDCSCDGQMLARNVSRRVCYDETNRITQSENIRQNQKRIEASRLETKPKDIIQNTGAPENPPGAARTMN